MNISARAMVVSILVLGTAAPASLAQFDLTAPSQSKLAHFHLDGPIQESPASPNPLDLMFNPKKPLSFKDLLERFKKARDDDDVKAVILTVDNIPLGFAQLQELRQAIQQVRSADKEVYVYTEQMNTGRYLLLSAASRITMVPTGTLWLTGIFAESPYIRGLLDKLEIDVDIMQFEDYKSAGETFSRTGPSTYAEENVNWLLDGLYDSSVKMIADARQLSAEKVKALIDDGPYSSEQALKAGLIDAVQHRQDFFADLKERYNDPEIDRDYGEDEGEQLPDDFFGLVKFFMNAMKGAVQKSTAPSVAIVYVEGTISEGHSDQLGGGGGAYSTPIRKALNKAAKDDTVKAVVLRVDSPGGSALASEIILDATKRIAAKKPLIVSMGNVAGSGGYYVACGSHAIFADPTTITASIGVLGGKLVTTGMWNKAGVTWHEYQRGQNAGINGTGSRYDDRERAKIKTYMKDIYEIFKGHVVACRGDKLTKPIGQIAGGRVFTGSQALELGLVDKLGGLNDAIKYAAAEAKVGDYEIRIIPRPKEPLEMLMEMMGQGPDDEDDVTTATPRPRLFAPGSPLFQAVLPMLQQLEPTRLGAMLRTLQRLELLQTESVLTMMPEEILIR